MRRSVPIGIGLAMLVAACSFRDSDDRGSAQVQGANLTRRDSALTLGPGDVKVVNEDSSVEMAVVGQQIVVRFSDKTMEKIRQQTDTTHTDSGFGGSIERMVKRTVQSALGRQMTYPLSDVRDAKYEDGAIVLDANSGKQQHLLANSNFNGKKLLESFRPDDAKRFVDAVNKKKGL